MAFNAPKEKTYKPTVEDCIAIDTVMLRTEGMLAEWMEHRLGRQWRSGRRTVGDLIISTIFTAGAAEATLGIEGDAFGQPIQQSLRLVSKPMRFGGKRWYIVCPATGRLCCKVILPPGGRQFASVGGWGVGYRTQRSDAVSRAQKASTRLQGRLQGLPARARRTTIARLAQRIEAKEAFLDRVTHNCERDLACGRRMSVRRAAKGAIISC